LPTEEYEWSRTSYQGAKEEIPHNILAPKGKWVVLARYVDANLLHCVVTGKAATAWLHMINQMVVSWSSLKQKTVETATYGFEFVAACKKTQQNMELTVDAKLSGSLSNDPHSYLVKDYLFLCSKMTMMLVPYYRL
jgi:hypothetical protein